MIISIALIIGLVFFGMPIWASYLHIITWPADVVIIMLLYKKISSQSHGGTTNE